MKAFPALGGLAHRHSYLGHLQTSFELCIVQGAAPEDHPEATTDQNVVAHVVMVALDLLL